MWLLAERKRNAIEMTTLVKKGELNMRPFITLMIAALATGTAEAEELTFVAIGTVT